MRLCPSVEGSPSPLITHRIGAEVCMARQRTFFHKCHRCIYRGQAADWEPETPTTAMINVHAAEEATQVDVKEVDLTRKAPVKKTPAKSPAKAPARPAAKSADSKPQAVKVAPTKVAAAKPGPKPVAGKPAAALSHYKPVAASSPAG